MTGPVTTDVLVGELAKAIHLSLHPGGNFEMARDNQSPGWMAADALAEQIAADFIAPLLAAHQQVTAERDEARAKQRDMHRRAQKAESFRERHRGGFNYLMNGKRKERFARRAAEASLATATSELARLRAEGEAKDRRIAALEAALEPFAWFGEVATPDTTRTWSGVRHTERISTRFRHEHFRAARTALARAATAREGA